MQLADLRKGSTYRLTRKYYTRWPPIQIVAVGTELIYKGDSAYAQDYTFGVLSGAHKGLSFDLSAENVQEMVGPA